ncbi:TauD/TfdA family dioxygenase [Legionella feeleii]|uniref:Carbon starvation induced protein n=1 Tax=Legionella feeleii TaxID=453 RepID=A0A0W0TKV1_9GAMM|nr:TauD/TfdA family dioxygenase [Legionella feeleii]KTC96208.1 carbon starvation induced protein [Legionella feeleii]SPX60986.1 carbon starvation induced protein [Legionella feeleii]
MFEMQAIIPENWDLLDKPINETSSYNSCHFTEEELISKPEPVFDKLNQHGFSIVSLKTAKTLEEATLLLDTLFANRMLQSRMIDNFHTIITPVADSKRILHSDKAQTLHVDCGDNNVQPEIVILYCIEAAKSGGENLIVPVSAILAYLNALNLSANQLEALYDKKAITYERGASTLTSSIMHKDKNGTSCISIMYADRIRCKTSLHEALFKTILEFAHREENQIKIKLNDGDILIIKNHQVLHGRSRFEGQRKMVRIWYKGSCK